MEKQFDPIPSVWPKMLDILLFWASKGVDGVRVDMAEMVPVEFFAWAIGQVKKKYKKFIFIGECYDPSKYDAYLSAGFDYLYDKVANIFEKKYKFYIRYCVYGIIFVSLQSQ